MIEHVGRQHDRRRGAVGVRGGARPATRKSRTRSRDSVFVPALNRADSAVRIAEHELQSRTSDDASTTQSANISHTSTRSVVALLLALIIAASIAFWLTRSISQSDLRSASPGMRAVADGDLAYRARIVPTDRSTSSASSPRAFVEMTRQLAELDKLKAEFVSVASHELKTPINVMIGYLQLLEEGVYGPLTPQAAGHPQTLGVQANTLLRLVKQLLDVSRFEAGGGRLEPRSVRLDDLLRELERAFHVLAVQREIDFRVERRGRTARRGVLGPRSHQRGTRQPAVECVQVHAARRHGVAHPRSRRTTASRMGVRDTGAGIPPEQLPRIFEKFYQADNQGSARAAGIGLGTCHREADRRSPRRHDLVREHSRCRDDVHDRLPPESTRARRAARHRAACGVARRDARRDARSHCCAASSCRLSACVSFHAPGIRRSPAPRREWPTTLVAAQTRAREGKFDAADSVLAGVRDAVPQQRRGARGVVLARARSARSVESARVALRRRSRRSMRISPTRGRASTSREAAACGASPASSTRSTGSPSSALAQAKDANDVAANARAQPATLNARAEAKADAPAPTPRSSA